MKVVLTNSVGIDDQGYYIIHSPSRWSEGVADKGQWFAYYPWELAYLSTLLKQKTPYEVKLIDGCLACVNRAQLLNTLLNESPDVLVVETCSRTYDIMLKIACEVKRQLGTQLIFVGQHPTAFPDECLMQGADYVVLGEYEMSVLSLLQGDSLDDINGLYPNFKSELLDITQLPWPEDEDVRRIDYALPGEPSSEYLEVQCYATRGCLGSCPFCVARHLYYGRANHRVRDPQDVVDEIVALAGKYPQMEGVFFDEEAHNQNPIFLEKLLDTILRAGLEHYKFEAMCDLRYMRHDLIPRMREAGYYKVRFGIESGCEKMRTHLAKPIKGSWILETLYALKRSGIKTYGTFMIGAPGTTGSKDEKTLSFIKDMIMDGLLDNVQISICTPQPGTPLYYHAKEQGWLRDLPFSEYDGGRCSVLTYPTYAAQEIEAMAKRALYLRDHWFLRHRIKGGIGPMCGWVAQSLKKRGIGTTMVKAAKRVSRELEHRWQKSLS